VAGAKPPKQSNALNQGVLKQLMLLLLGPGVDSERKDGTFRAAAGLTHRRRRSRLLRSICPVRRPPSIEPRPDCFPRRRRSGHPIRADVVQPSKEQGLHGPDRAGGRVVLPGEAPLPLLGKIPEEEDFPVFPVCRRSLVWQFGVSFSAAIRRIRGCTRTTRDSLSRRRQALRLPSCFRSNRAAGRSSVACPSPGRQPLLHAALVDRRAALEC